MTPCRSGGRLAGDELDILERLSLKWGMPDIKVTQGSCLCGGVRFEIRGSALRFAYCHCKSCRKSSGSAHVSNIGLPKENLRWLAGEELIQVFTDEVENPGFRRAFCRQCGCAFPSSAGTARCTWFRPGSWMVTRGIRPDVVIWWDEHAPWLKNLDALDKLGLMDDRLRRPGARSRRDSQASIERRVRQRPSSGRRLGQEAGRVERFRHSTVS
jgi:hypothetical protein